MDFRSSDSQARARALRNPVPRPAHGGPGPTDRFSLGGTAGGGRKSIVEMAARRRPADRHPAPTRTQQPGHHVPSTSRQRFADGPPHRRRGCGRLARTRARAASTKVWECLSGGSGWDYGRGAGRAEARHSKQDPAGGRPAPADCMARFYPALDSGRPVSFPSRHIGAGDYACARGLFGPRPHTIADARAADSHESFLIRRSGGQSKHIAGRAPRRDAGPHRGGASCSPADGSCSTAPARASRWRRPGRSPRAASAAMGGKLTKYVTPLPVPGNGIVVATPSGAEHVRVHAQGDQRASCIRSCRRRRVGLRRRLRARRAGRLVRDGGRRATAARRST